MIWKKEFNAQAMKAWSKDTLVDNLGIEIIGVEEDTLIGYMPVDHRTKQLMGLLHGGASAAFAETLGSVASYLILEEGSNQIVVGTDIQATHIKSVKTGKVKGKASPILLGNTIHVWLIEIFNENDQLICHAKLNCFVKGLKH